MMSNEFHEKGFLKSSFFHFNSDCSNYWTGLLTLILLSVTLNSEVMAYTFTDLGPNVEPKAINNQGVIVGAMNTDQYPSNAFQWSSVDGFELINGNSISANALNETGQVAGNTIDGAFVLDGNYRDWRDYGAFGINQWGEVAGYEVGTNPYQPRSLPFNPAIFDGSKWKVFDIAKLYPRGTRQGVYADRYILNDINEGRYAVGYKYRYGLSGSSAILIDTNGTVNDASDVDFLPIPNGGSASAINSENKIVGTTGTNASAGEYSVAFLYDFDSGAYYNLGTLPVNETEYGLNSSAYDINDSNQVVGSSRLITALTSLNDPTKYHAFIWEPGADDSLENGTMADLNDLVQLPNGWILSRATAINNDGDIVGVGLVDGIEEHGFLLNSETIPEPPTGNQPPVAVASASSGKGPLTVEFDSTGSSDPDGSIVLYSWESTDGTFSSVEANPSYKFSEPGSYEVLLTVTDDQSATASASITVTVSKGKGK